MLIISVIEKNLSQLVKSKHSKFLGINIEWLGIVYYILIGTSFIFILLLKSDFKDYLIFFSFVVTAIALLFSLYLFVISILSSKYRKCLVCILNLLVISLLLFLISSIGLETVIRFFSQCKGVFVGLHLFGLVLGLGGATISDIMFFKFLRDLKISKFEKNVLHAFSQIIWLGLGILLFSGFSLYLPRAEELNHSSKFLVKALVVLIIIINGSFLNLFISPKLTSIPFKKSFLKLKSKNLFYRHLAVALGSISFVSWYTAFVLGMLKSVPLTFIQLFGLYFMILFFAVITGQIVERRVFH